MDIDSVINTKKITGSGKIVIDATGFDLEPTMVIKADMSEFTGTIEVVNKPCVTYEITNEGLIVKEIALSEHNASQAVVENRIESTCTKEGSYDSVVYCQDCHKELSRTTVVLPLAEHTASEAVKENEVASTCTTKGSYDLVVYCRDCHKELSREQVILPLLPHEADEAVRENEVASTCEKEGSYEAVVYCRDCHKELSRETVVIPLAAHTEEVIPGKAATCTKTGLTDGKKCSVCDRILVEQEQIPLTSHTHDGEWHYDAAKHWHTCKDCAYKTDIKAHSWGKGEVTKKPTTENDGERVYTCLCGATRTEVIEKIPADYEPDDNIGSIFGCDGSVVSSLFGLVALTGFVVIARKRKED